MPIKITVEGEPLGPALERSLDKAVKEIDAAMHDAAEGAADEILTRGRADISGAGRFGTRWTEGLTAEVKDESAKSVSITVREAVPYWSVFQYGKQIVPKNKTGLLWIPLPGVDRNERGDFFQISRKGNPILFKKEGGGIRPLRVGKESVYIPKKFHLVEITRDVANSLGRLYRVSVSR